MVTGNLENRSLARQALPYLFPSLFSFHSTFGPLVQGYVCNRARSGVSFAVLIKISTLVPLFVRSALDYLPGAPFGSQYEPAFVKQYFNPAD